MTDSAVEKKLLAEWFWVDRWDGSSAPLLPMEAQGVYRAMLSQAWRRGAALPADLEQVQLLIRCRASEWQRAWPLVRRYWREQDGQLVNDTQREVYAVALAAAMAAAKKARDAANKRWGNQPDDDAQALPEHVPEQCPPSPSPSTNTKRNTPPTPLRGEPGVPVSMSGRVLVALNELAAAYIAAGGAATRKWKRTAREQLTALGVDAGRAVVEGWIEQQCAATTAGVERAQASALVRALVDRARASGRDGRREWAAVLAQLELVVNAHSVSTWFRPLLALGIVTDDEGDRLLLSAPNETFVTWVEKSYQDQLAAATAAAGLEVTVKLLVWQAEALAG
jgi:uncharacterized protein YdaU (DUF1376 family)